MSKFLLINTAQAYEEYLKSIRTPVAFDCETKGLGYAAELIGFSFSSKFVTRAFVYTDNLFPDGIPMKDFVEVSNKYIYNFDVYGHNAKYDLGVARRCGINLPNLIADTAAYVHLYDPALQKKLETCAVRDLGWEKPTYEQIIGKKWGKVDWDKDILPSKDKKTGATLPPIITPQNMGEYACDDTDATLKLYDLYKPKLEADDLLKIYTNIEGPIIPVLLRMYDRGVLIDKALLRKMEIKLTSYSADLTKKIYICAGTVFNINSGKQKAKVLFEDMGLPVSKKTKGGADSTDTDTLAILADKGYDIAKHLVEYSEVQKLLSGYVQPIPHLVNADGRLRCSLNANGTATGRFSCADPNLQNVSNNTKFPVRSAFIPAKGYRFGICDYSQFEPRIMAHLSQDPKMCKIFNDRGDIYQGIADELRITRKGAKVVMLAISYGMGPGKLAGSLNISLKEAQAIIDLFYVRYNVLARYKQGVEELAAKQGYVKTMYGRIRRLPNIRSSDRGLYYGALRQAFNHKIQGTQADLIKMAMVNLHKKWEKKDMWLLLQIHDELVTEIPDNMLEEGVHDLESTMTGVAKLRVPILAEAKICANWAQMKDDNFKGLPFNIKPKQQNLIWQTFMH